MLFKTSFKIFILLHPKLFQNYIQNPKLLYHELCFIPIRHSTLYGKNHLKSNSPTFINIPPLIFSCQDFTKNLCWQQSSHVFIIFSGLSNKYLLLTFISIFFIFPSSPVFLRSFIRNGWVILANVFWHLLI